MPTGIDECEIKLSKLEFEKKLNTQASGELKHADVIPVHKKNEKRNKTNYRPVSILNISNTYKKLLYNQLSNYFDSLLATNQ